jgi:tetratricopeptide (TPR) repeat protein
VQLKPQYAPGYYGLALSHASLGDADQALALIARAAELDPNQPEYLTQRGLWTALFRRDFVEGGRLTEAATRAKNASEWGDLVHGYVRLMAGDAAGCLANLADAAKVRPPTGKYQERKAIETACTLKAGDEQAARALYAQVDAKSREYLERGCPKEMPEFLKIEIKDLAAILKPIMPVGHALVPKP